MRIVIAIATTLWWSLVMSLTRAAAGEPLSFRYEEGKPEAITIGRYVGGPPGTQVSSSTPVVCSGRRHQVRVPSVDGMAYVYASFPMGTANPTGYDDHRPDLYQTVSLGYVSEDRFTEAARFGMVDDDRASAKNMARYTPGFFDGCIEYYGMFARPKTTYDFRIRLALDRQRVTAWVSGQGDDEWFPLAVDVPLANPVPEINAFRVDQLPKATGVERLLIQDQPWAEGERLRTHPSAKKDRVVRPGAGFRCQSMRSLWRQADRHVTVARNPNSLEGWWLGFPDIVQTGPTTLICSYNDGPGHSGGGRLWVRRSDDLGRNWGQAVVVHPGGVNSPRIQKLRDGSLLVLADLHGETYPVVLYRSTDGGHTWTFLGKLDPVAAGGHGTCVPGHVLELADGSWLAQGSFILGKAWQLKQGEAVGFFRSEDRAQSWKVYSSLAPSAPLSISEASVVPLANGRWLLLARESGGFVPGLKAWSNDQGKTWSPLQELAFLVQGRTSASLLKDGRVMMTFRANTGPASLWAWLGDPVEKPRPLIRGVHFNDRFSVGLRDRELHIDNDGMCGQFTKYVFRVPDRPESRIEVTVVVKVTSNNGGAATLSVPFVGKLRFFPERVCLAHDPTLSVTVAPGEFHTYHVARDAGKMTLSVDGRQSLATEKIEKQICKLAWSAQGVSPYLPSFGNEEADDEHGGFDWVPSDLRDKADSVDTLTAAPGVVLPQHITPAVTGHSVWRTVDVRYEDSKTGGYHVSWRADQGDFPDQYQLDRILEVDGTISGCDQGYSGWVELDDGRILVVNYTDDTARWNCDSNDPALGVSWIRGTFILPEDRPPAARY